MRGGSHCDSLIKALVGVRGDFCTVAICLMKCGIEVGDETLVVLIERSEACIYWYSLGRPPWAQSPGVGKPMSRFRLPAQVAHHFAVGVLGQFWSAQPPRATLGDIGYVGHAGDFGTQNWLTGRKMIAGCVQGWRRKTIRCGAVAANPVRQSDQCRDSSTWDTKSTVWQSSPVQASLSVQSYCKLNLTFDHQAVELAKHARSHTPLKAREES